MFEYAIRVLKDRIRDNNSYIFNKNYEKLYPQAYESFKKDNSELEQAIKILQEEGERWLMHYG